MCRISILRRRKNDTIKKLKNEKLKNHIINNHNHHFYGLSCNGSGNDSKRIARSMEKIEKGQAIANIKEFDKAKLFEVSQYWKR